MFRALFVVVALLIFAPAFAQTYAILGAGFSNTDAAGSNQGTVPAYAGLGYLFGKSVAIEATYADLDSGKEHRSASASTTINPATVTQASESRKWSGKGAGLYLIGFHPVSSSLSLVGRVGAVRLKGETATKAETLVFDNTPGTGTLLSHTVTDVSTSERIWASTIGIGLQEKLGEHTAFRGMLEQVNGRHGEFKRARMVSVGLMYSF